MTSASASVDSKEVRCFGLQMQLIIYAFINLLIKGTELMIPVISTCVMIAPLLSGNDSAFHHYLNDEGNRVIWKGPYPENFSVASSLLTVDPDRIANKGNDTNADNIINLTHNHNLEVIKFQSAQLRINLHIWSASLLMKCVIFVFGWALLFSARKESYSGFLAWISFSVPLFFQYVLQFLMDLLLGDFFRRQLYMQILQGLDLIFQAVGILGVSFGLYKAYRKCIRGDDGMNNSYATFQPENEVSIQEIINQRY